MNELSTKNELIERAKQRDDIFVRAESGSNALKKLACISLAAMERDGDFKTLGFQSINEYAQKSADVHKSVATKMLSAGRDWLALGFSPLTPEEELPEGTYVRMYEARNLLGKKAPVEEVYSHAITLSEGEIITQHKINKAGVHEPNFLEICTICKVDKTNHE